MYERCRGICMGGEEDLQVVGPGGWHKALDMDIDIDIREGKLR
jgi:hypothetical protein